MANRKYHQHRENNLLLAAKYLLKYVLPFAAISFIVITVLLLVADNDIHVPQKEVGIVIDTNQAISDYQDAK